MALQKLEVNTKVKEARPPVASIKTSTKLRIAGILHESLVDGPGIRTVLFTQGCHHSCRGCHSKSTWDIAGGVERTISSICRDIFSYKYLDGLTISGGEPFIQSDALLKLIDKVKDLSPSLNIWLYSGYKLEELIEMSTLVEPVKEVLLKIDVLVEGRYIHKLRDLKLQFRGSKNQRILGKEEYLPLLDQVENISQQAI